MFEKRVVVFFLSELTDEGDVFKPINDFGFAEMKDGETSKETAKRFVLEKQRSMNCMVRSGRSYELTILAYTEPTTIIAAENPEAHKFLREEQEIDVSFKDCILNHSVVVIVH